MSGNGVVKTAEYIEREAFITRQRELYCQNCDRCRGMKDGKLTKHFVYPIGGAPCRACDVDDMINAVEDYPAADVVARDCYDKILAENDDMRAIIDTYGGIENIQSAFVKLHEIEAADVRPVVLCRDCKWYQIDELKKDGTEDRRYKPSVCMLAEQRRKPNHFCADGEKREES